MAAIVVLTALMGGLAGLLGAVMAEAGALHLFLAWSGGGGLAVSALIARRWRGAQGL
mgnify:CR=1 FL=1